MESTSLGERDDAGLGQTIPPFPLREESRRKIRAITVVHGESPSLEGYDGCDTVHPTQSEAEIQMPCLRGRRRYPRSRQHRIGPTVTHAPPPAHPVARHVALQDLGVRRKRIAGLGHSSPWSRTVRTGTSEDRTTRSVTDPRR